MGKEEFWKVYWAEGTFSWSLDVDEINWIVHYNEYGIVKFHRGAKIHRLGRGLPSPFSFFFGVDRPLPRRHHYRWRDVNNGVPLLLNLAPGIFTFWQVWKITHFEFFFSKCVNIGHFKTLWKKRKLRLFHE